MSNHRSMIAALTLRLLATVSAVAQQTSGSPGSPSATTTISGEQLPALPPKFGGKIERNAAQSSPYWAGARGAAERCA